MNKKILLVIIPILLSLGLFQNAKAMTIPEIQAQITELQTKISQLQSQLARIQPEEGTTWCHDFNTDLQIDNSGPDVEALQYVLVEKEHFIINKEEIDIDKFGTSTWWAVKGFQEKYASEILTPLGLTNGTGFVGASTRAKLNIIYGCPKLPLIIISPNGGETWVSIDHVTDTASGNEKFLQYIKWTGGSNPNATDSVDAYLEQLINGQYIKIGRILPAGHGSIAWVVGVVSNPNCTFPDGVGNLPIPSDYCWLRTNMKVVPPGQYYVHLIDRITKSEDRSNTPFSIVSSTTACGDGVCNGTETCTNCPADCGACIPPAPILSPVGGETWQQGTSQIIRWTPSGYASSVIISLSRNGIYQKSLMGAMPDSYGQWTWNIPADQQLGSLYSIRVSRLSYPKDFIADSNYFSITETACGKLNNDCCTTDRCDSGLICDLGPGYSRKCLQDPGSYCTNWTDNTFVGGNPGCQGSYRCCNQKCTFTSYSSSCPSTQPSITLLSPNGGENLYEGQQFEIRWTTNNIPSTNTFTIIIMRDDHANGEIVRNLPSTQRSYIWTVKEPALGFGLKSSSLGSLLSTPITLAQTTSTETHTYTIWISTGVYPNTIEDGSDGNFTIIFSSLSCSNFSCQGAQTSCRCGTAVTSAINPYCCNASNNIYSTQASCQADPACKSSFTCTDSDGGKNYYVKGVVQDSGTAQSTSNPYTDDCLNSSTLREYFCLTSSLFPSGTAGQEDYSCPNGCIDGACKVANTNISPNATLITDFPDPVTLGSNITFTGNWTESNTGDLVKMYVCKDATCTNCNNTSQTNCWCTSSNWNTQPDTTDTCAAQAVDFGVHDYWLGVCDDQPSCDATPLAGGTFTVIPSGCVPNNPTVTLSPSLQSGIAGATLNYKVNVKNNDTAACAARAFNFFVVPPVCPAGWTCNLSWVSVFIKPGVTDSSIVFSVRSSGSAPAGSYGISVTANGSGGSSGTGSATYKVSVGAGCPILNAWDGNEFKKIELLNIHAPKDQDTSYTSAFSMRQKDGKYELILHEAAYYFWDGSHINSVKLVDSTGKDCHLISAVHSKDGDVLKDLLNSDDIRARTYPEDEIKLVYDGCSGNDFTFTIEGYNMKTTSAPSDLSAIESTLASVANAISQIMAAIAKLKGL